MKSKNGSSPRVWGTLAYLSVHAISHRFIPTGVGNTTENSKKWKNKPVHPHGCGEHSKVGSCISGESGSSPRVWGTHL